MLMDMFSILYFIFLDSDYIIKSHIIKPSLCAILSVCHIVATSDGRKKAEMGVSADWCVAVEYQRLSSIRIIFINYQTSELQCNY